LSSACYRLSGTFLGSSIGARPLTVNGQIHAVAQTSRTANFNKAFYIKLDLSPKISFNFATPRNDSLNAANLFIIEIFSPDSGLNTRISQNLLAGCLPYAIYILQCYPYGLILRNIYTCNSWHIPLSLPLLVPGILTNNHDHTFAPYDLALSATFLY
jgi:hypothetical protein